MATEAAAARAAAFPGLAGTASRGHLAAALAGQRDRRRRSGRLAAGGHGLAHRRRRPGKPHRAPEVRDARARPAHLRRCHQARHGMADRQPYPVPARPGDAPAAGQRRVRRAEGLRCPGRDQPRRLPPGGRAAVGHHRGQGRHARRHHGRGLPGADRDPRCPLRDPRARQGQQLLPAAAHDGPAAGGSAGDAAHAGPAVPGPAHHGRAHRPVRPGLRPGPRPPDRLPGRAAAVGRLRDAEAARLSSRQAVLEGP